MGCAFVDEDKVGEGVAYWQGGFRLTGDDGPRNLNIAALRININPF